MLLITVLSPIKFHLLQILKSLRRLQIKTVFINCSPKKKLSASAFIINVCCTFVGGSKFKEHLRTKADYKRILDVLKDADTIVFALPLYVDALPSHLLPFLKELEQQSKKDDLELNVYALANNGFIEGRQNEPLMQILENFCLRSGLNWCGGLGIGGGVMMNVMRILIVVFIAITILNMLFSGMAEGNFLPVDALLNLALQILVFIILGCGIIYQTIRLAICINNKKQFGNHYTRMMLPSFLFILCADIYFIVVSLFHGGLFRGWLSKKKPSYKTAYYKRMS